MAAIKSYCTCIVLLWWATIHTATSETDLHGLLNNIIMSSSSRRQASIEVSERQREEGERTRFNIDLETDVSNHTTDEDSSSGSQPTATDTTVIDNDDSDYSYAESYEVDTSNMALPEPELLVPRDRILKTRIMTERELEKSHTEAKEMRKEQVKSVLLRKLQLDRLPNPGVAEYYSRFPHHILQGLSNERMQMDAPKREDNYHAKIDQMLRFSQEVPQEKATRIPADKLNATMYFPMPFSLTETSLEKATLLIYVDTPPGYEGQQVTLNVLTNPWAKTVLSRPMTLTSGGHWEHIDITEQCITWLKHEWENNLGLVVEAEVMGIDLINYSSNHSSSNRSLERLPLVKLEINEKEYNSRNRRSVHSDLPLACNPEDNERRCCRYPFVLDFDELGPDFKFIISPKRYWANYCKGVCPDYVLPSSPNIQLTRGVHRSQRCCTPSSVDSLTLIYVNENQDIMRGVIPGMSISSCGCE